MRPDLETRRSAHAWQKVDVVAGLPNEVRLYWAIEAKKLPVRIMVNGLGQGLEIVKTNAPTISAEFATVEWRLEEHLTDWCIRELRLPGRDPHSLQNSLLGDPLFSRRAMVEALAWLQWANRFAEARGIKPKAIAEANP